MDLGTGTGPLRPIPPRPLHTLTLTGVTRFRLARTTRPCIPPSTTLTSALPHRLASFNRLLSHKPLPRWFVP